MDATTRAEVAQLREAGWTQAAIAAELGLSRGAVWRACQPDAGRPRSRPSEPDFEPQAGDVVVLVTVLASAAVWLWGRFRRWTHAAEAEPPPSWPAGLPWACRRRAPGGRMRQQAPHWPSRQAREALCRKGFPSAPAVQNMRCNFRV